LGFFFVFFFLQIKSIKPALPSSSALLMMREVCALRGKKNKKTFFVEQKKLALLPK